MRYVTKVDTWIGAAVLIGPITTLVVAIAIPKPVVWLICLFSLAIVGSLVWPCDYTPMDDHLLIRSGLLRFKIPYDQIASIEPTRNPLSSPAWSLDRVEIAYGDRRICVSPARKEEFMADLAARVGLVNR